MNTLTFTFVTIHGFFKMDKKNKENHIKETDLSIEELESRFEYEGVIWFCTYEVKF